MEAILILKVVKANLISTQSPPRIPGTGYATACRVPSTRQWVTRPPGTYGPPSSAIPGSRCHPRPLLPSAFIRNLSRLSSPPGGHATLTLALLCAVWRDGCGGSYGAVTGRQKDQGLQLHD